jgi:phytoene desaturase (3,4-didehydrolycopene-forming)
VFAPVGGFQSVYNAFKRLAESYGVVIQYNTTVTKVCPNGVYCIESCESDNEGAQSASNATWIPSNLVVVNADLPYALNTMLNWERTDKDDVSKIIYDWDQKFDYSSGVIAFHWCISRPLDELNTHNVFLCSENTTEAKKSWAVLRTTPTKTETPLCIVQEPFNFYVHRPCKSDPSAAPDGYESLTILVPCQTLNHRAELGKVRKIDSMKVYRTQFDDEHVSKVREAVLTRLSVLKVLENLKDAILYESIDTPATYADKYNLAAGTPFGLVSAPLVGLL